MKAIKNTPVLMFVFILLPGIANRCPGQNVGINSTGSAPDPSAMLDVDATDKGFLPPRLTTTQRDNIPAACSCTPVAGLQIYNTTTNCLENKTLYPH